MRLLVLLTLSLLLLVPLAVQARPVQLAWDAYPPGWGHTGFVLQGCREGPQGCVPQDRQWLRPRAQQTVVQIPPNGRTVCVWLVAVRGTARSLPSEKVCFP